MTEVSRPSSTVRFGVFEADLQAGELRRRGRKLKLQDQPFQVLALLLERPGEVVSREELRAKLWSEETFVEFDHSLNTAVSKIREALGDSADTPRYVETLPRRGYRFIYPVEGAPSAPAKAPPVWVWGVGVGLAVVLLLAVALNPGGLRDRLLGRPAPGEITSIAVLPLENLSGDPEQDYFVDGMTETLITELSKIGALTVISRQSVMQFKGSDKPLPEIARQLGVDAVVEGSALHIGERVRITVQLIEAARDRNLWAENYDRELSDVLALHSEVSRAIAEEIKIVVTPEEEARLASARPVNPEAYEAYLKGRYHFDKYGSQGWRKGVEYLEQAIAHDPSYAAAYAKLAVGYAFWAIPDLVPLTREGVETTLARARSAARKAVELDDSSSETHAALGRLAFWRLDWANAESAFRRAIELDPSNADAHHGYAFYLVARERTEEAIAEMRRAQELDPLSPHRQVAAHWPFYRTRRYDEAIAELQKALELNPNSAGAYNQLGQNYMKQGMSEQGLAAFQKAIDLSGERRPGFLARLTWGYAASGRKGQALKVLEELKAMAKSRYVIPLHFVSAYAGLGEKDLALLWLQRAYEERSLDTGWLTTLGNPLYDDLRDDPRFQSVLRRLDFPE
jgi:TolB-like protein/DNA-binding winged helix-turn-helix (wHTH) protein/Flp pilus assembly protein TadD